MFILTVSMVSGCLLEQMIFWVALMFIGTANGTLLLCDISQWRVKSTSADLAQDFDLLKCTTILLC